MPGDASPLLCGHQNPGYYRRESHSSMFEVLASTCRAKALQVRIALFGLRNSP